ncbi:MAG: hypothetical protein ACRDV9_13005 [Acidimicrobiia bacterium]
MATTSKSRVVRSSLTRRSSASASRNAVPEASRAQRLDLRLSSGELGAPTAQAVDQGAHQAGHGHEDRQGQQVTG